MVQAAATASAPVDVSVALNGFLNFPRKNDASWVTTLFILSSFSFEHYYGVPGLARSVINDDYYEISRKAYEREPFDAADVPTDLRKLVRADYFDPQFFAGTATRSEVLRRRTRFRPAARQARMRTSATRSRSKSGRRRAEGRAPRFR